MKRYCQLIADGFIDIHSRNNAGLDRKKMAENMVCSTKKFWDNETSNSVTRHVTSPNGLPVVKKGKTSDFLTRSPILQPKFQHWFDWIFADLRWFTKLQSSAEGCSKDCWVTKKAAERRVARLLWHNGGWEWQRLGYGHSGIKTPHTNILFCLTFSYEFKTSSGS